MSFKIEVKRKDIWNKVKEIKGIKFHGNPVYDVMV